MNRTIQPEPQPDHWYREQVFAPGMVPIYAKAATHETDVAPHDHAFVEIVAVLDGSAKHVTSDGRTDLRPGDALVLRPGVWHGYAEPRKLRIFNCCFGGELLNRELAWTLEDPAIGHLLWGPRHGGGAIHFHLPPAVVRQCARDMGSTYAPQGRAVPIGRLLVFLGALSQEARARRNAAEFAIPARVAEVVRHLEAQIARPWRMDDLARIACVNAAYLTRRFTAAMGLAPMQYLARCRAERAAALLIQTTEDIADIAISVGWDDPVYFARRFRQHYGMPAREYRRRFGSPTNAADDNSRLHTP